jgi:curved DNA-binding protein CbpA
MAKAFHPDVNPGAAAADRMRRINEAWRILSDPARRERYDASRRTASWPGPVSRADARTAPSAGSAYGSRTRHAGWAPWPESRVSPAPRVRRPPRSEPVEPSFGDRPAVFFAISALLGVLYFVGTWLGSLTP